MKKFIAGVMVGALIFGAAPVFADTVKSLIGQKVTGVYTVEHGGKKLADGAVINGSAYVPVRAMAEATNTPLSVEGKKIKLGQATEQDVNNEKVHQINVLESKKRELERGIDEAEGGIKLYETDIIPLAREFYENASNDAYKQEYKERLEKRIKEYDEYKTKLNQLQTELKEVEAQIESLK